MTSSVYDPERVEDRNRLIAMDEVLPPVLASLPDASGEADDIAECLFERHRGAYADEGGSVVVFGNDGFSVDHRSRSEVAQVVDSCLRLGLSLEAFGVCRGGYTWALILSCPGEECGEGLVADLLRAVWYAWCDASGVPRPSDRAWAVRTLARSATARRAHDWSRNGF